MGRPSLLDGNYSPSQELWGIVTELDVLRQKLVQVIEVDDELKYSKDYYHAMISIGDASDYIRKLRPRASREKVSNIIDLRGDFIYDNENR